MKKSALFLGLLAMVCFLTLAGCSGGKEKEEEKEQGAIKELTDKTAHEMVDKMNAPIDQARAVTNLQEEQNKALNETKGQ